MNPFDIRTVMFSYVISNAIALLVMLRLWQLNRRRFHGISFWLADYALQFLAVFLILLRESIPEGFTVLAGNGSVILGTILLYIGLERFTGRRGPQWQNLLLLTGFLGLHAYFFFVTPSLTARNLNLSAGLFLICAQCAWLLLRRIGPELKPITVGPAGIFLAYGLVSIVRFTVDALRPGGNDFFQSGIVDTVAILIYQMLFIALTFNLFLMVNRRLISDLEEDLAVRRRMEEALRISGEKFTKAFHSSPDAILISRASDGRFLEVNDGFCRMTEYTREEALASSSLSLALWDDPKDRDIVVAQLRRDGRIRLQEHDFRAKSGTRIRGLFSGEIIELDGEAHIVSVVHDITERRQMEEVLRLRVHLWEYATTHSVNELMQESLDRIGEITESPIGFFHFVEEDQRTLSLQAWSTRTLQEFCRAEGDGMHYDIAQAGIWADAVRERKPILHNRYATEPNRRGLPTGHAEVLRELVVPTLRGGRVVSALGIGNKPTEYTRQDLDLVSNIADIIWTIVDYKRSVDQVHELQAKLREMAIHDPLTGLLNRYFLEETLKRELARGAREKYPVSFVMIDIDHFKRVNDSYGHHAGDAVLQSLATLLQKRSRVSDLIYRYGGEEFLVVLPKVNTEMAFQIAEKWRKDFDASSHILEHGGVMITISCGIATFPGHGKTAKDLIHNADQALYQAKGAGRNQTVVWKKTTGSLHG